MARRLAVLLTAAALVVAGCGQDEQREATPKAAGTSASVMNEARFWSIIDGVGSPETLHRRLEGLSDADLAAFERIWDHKDADAYTWPVWGAAYVINGGCSDDCFDYFLAYLISRGRTVYETALRNPDELADLPIETEGEDTDWEGWMFPTWVVAERRTGEYGPIREGPPMRDAEPSGTEWDEGDDLTVLYPKLSAKFG